MAKEYTLLQWALAYANKGLAVFPLIPKDKKPLTKNGCLDATTDKKQIKAWWTKNPNANIGIATGFASAGLFVIDLDVDENKGKNGYETLREWEKVHGALPDTWQSITGRGGYHLFYWSLEPINNRVNLLDGIDIRGEGGYIVAPPSVHPNGRKYEWEQSPEEYELIEAPDIVFELINHKNERDHQPFVSPVVIAEGERNSTLFRLASSLQARGLEEDSIMAAVMSENERKCQPSLPDKEIELIVKSACRYKRGTAPYHSVLDNGVFKPVKVPDRKVICLGDVESQKTSWLWYPYIPLGKVSLVQGDPGSSKTMVCLKIASIVSRGGLFPGEDENPFQKKEAATVIYQTAEDGIADTIKPRLERMNPDFSRIFIIDESDSPLTLLDCRIEETLAELKPKLMIIDPLQAYLGAGVDMHRANEVRPVLAAIGRLAEKYNCAILFIMHMSKMTSNKALYRGLGSIDIPAVARSILVIGRDPNNPEIRVMAHEKSSLAKNGLSISYHIDFDNGGIVFDGFNELRADEILSPAKDERKRNSLALDEAKEFIEEVLSRTGYIKVSEIEKQADERGIKRQTLYNAKKELGVKSKRVGFGPNGISWWVFDGVEAPE